MDRPMKLILSTEEEQHQVLKNARKLKDNFPTIRINKDMTPLERAERRALVEEMKRKQRESDASGRKEKWLIRWGKVVKGRMMERENPPI